MKFIDVALGELAVRALLNEESAPTTCAAIWDSLPVTGTAVHATVSGQGFRMMERLRLPDLPFESATNFRHPGQISYYPPNDELGFCVGESRFALYRGVQITAVAEIEHPLSEWAELGDNLQFSGSLPLTVKRAADQETPFRRGPLEDGWLTFELNGQAIQVDLLPALRTGSAAQIGREIVGNWRLTQSTWGGPVARVWMPPEFRQTVKTAIGTEGNTTIFHWKDYVYLHRGDGDLRICLDDCQEYHRGAPAEMVPIGVIRSDTASFQKEFRRARLEGVQHLRVWAGS